MTGPEGRVEPIPVTVTFLEMSAPPLHYPVQPMNRALALFRTRTIPTHFYRYMMDRVGRKWQWVNVLRLDDEALAERLAAPEREISVLYLDGAPCGFYELTSMGDGTCELTFFGLMEHATGQGLGRWFLGAAIKAGWARPADRLVVQTCTLDHPAALSLYQKLGFRPYAQSQETVRPMSPDERAAAVAR